MFLLRHASNPASAYQTIRGALYTARRLTPRQRWLLMICDGRVTQADLVRATRLSAGEVSEALDFLRRHGLVRVVGSATRR